jgi:hypothetical protein
MDHTPFKQRPLVRGLILEGTGAAGKTSTFAAIRTALPLDPDNERSLFALTETYTQVLNESNGQLVRLNCTEHLALLERQVALIEAINDHVKPMGERTRRSSGLLFLLERVHLNHRASFARDKDFDAAGIDRLEDRLLALGAKCVLLTVSDGVIEDRALVRRNVQFDLVATKDARIAEIMAEQHWVREQVRYSSIPTLEINTDSMSWTEVAAQAMAFLEGDGDLTCRSSNWIKATTKLLIQEDQVKNPDDRARKSRSD